MTAEEVPWPRPDISDLNDWMMDHDPAIFAATRYLQPTNQYDIWLVIWHEAGRPTTDFESALWTEAEALG